ncbi:hypothetical protein IRT45_20755 [Nocardia sp. BSTN01]|uniref:hypothetical protein n=1 Tax=Nocardia sp. BSTN01 TaxID=2783665 RepID=UPI0018901B54|nr:hypothetical protein [Nocardia sp. BSTN01]MBF4999579.1 hypothetical protein [Nocardia sp. BSTN01]
MVTPFEWRFTETGPAVLTTVVNPRSAIFLGHFPGRPVVPGVCLIDLVDRAARASGITAAAVLTGVVSAKFADAVLPADELTVSLTRDGSNVTGAVHTIRGENCRITLRYEEQAWN